ncbi:MAG: hypothetical protein FJY37_14245 [Betaproteobacteria bacterium]|nr:hypothetical protein [Betaproteobacteria bacterium]
MSFGPARRHGVFGKDPRAGSPLAASIPAAAENVPPGPVTPDPFDPARFAANSTTPGGIGITKEMVTCPVRKPGKQEFVRVHPDADRQLQAHILELKEEQEVYLVVPEVAAGLPGETRTVNLRLAVSRQGAVFLWPVPIPRLDGRDTAWGRSARAAAITAETKWVRIVANMPQGAYDVHTASGAPGTPVWPDRSMRDILAVAFGESFTIRDLGHPVVKRLLGQA